MAISNGYSSESASDSCAGGQRSAVAISSIASTVLAERQMEGEMSAANTYVRYFNGGLRYDLPRRRLKSKRRIIRRGVARSKQLAP